jgi:hypothetical protein
VTDDLPGFEQVPFDPASMPTSSLGLAKAVWYRRPWVIATLSLVVIVAVSVVIDLPRPITKAQDAASQNASLKEINTDLAECAFAAKESFHIYNMDVSGKLTTSDLAQVPKLLTDDETACSFASEPVFDLTNNLQVTDTTAGKHIDVMKSVVQNWMTDYALASIRDIQYLFTHPGNASTIRHLASQERQLVAARENALNDEALADQVLDRSLHALKIPVLPHLIGT